MDITIAAAATYVAAENDPARNSERIAAYRVLVNNLPNDREVHALLAAARQA